jgi:hypothetical protein
VASFLDVVEMAATARKGTNWFVGLAVMEAHGQYLVRLIRRMPRMGWESGGSGHRDAPRRATEAARLVASILTGDAELDVKV